MTALTDTERVTTRKLKGRTRRAVTLSTKITPQELALITAASEADGRALGEWVREVLLKEIHSPPIALGMDHLMTEIVGLQLFVTNALTSVVCGDRISAEQYDELMRNVKTSKRRAAREVIAQYIAERQEESRD
jgi:hypothetical protein